MVKICPSESDYAAFLGYMNVVRIIVMLIMYLLIVYSCSSCIAFLKYCASQLQCHNLADIIKTTTNMDLKDVQWFSWQNESLVGTTP